MQKEIPEGHSCVVRSAKDGHGFLYIPHNIKYKKIFLELCDRLYSVDDEVRSAWIDNLAATLKVPFLQL